VRGSGLAPAGGGGPVGVGGFAASGGEGVDGAGGAGVVLCAAVVEPPSARGAFAAPAAPNAALTGPPRPAAISPPATRQESIARHVCRWACLGGCIRCGPWWRLLGLSPPPNPNRPSPTRSGLGGA